MGKRSTDFNFVPDENGETIVPREGEGCHAKVEKTPNWARQNRSFCCGVIILYYGEDYKGFCPKCGRDL